jgi:hypothetical protein
MSENSAEETDLIKEHRELRGPPFGDKCCYTCADYHGDRRRWTDIYAKCMSEEILKFRGGNPLDVAFNATPFTGCHFWRKQHTIGTLAQCVIKQLNTESD